MEGSNSGSVPAPFGRLEPLKVRDHWKDEARDFTPWLARDENLDLLGETIGLSLQLVGVEQWVGPFRADIVASDGEHNVIVENQLAATDHRHLGQLMVYAAGRRARTVVWIATQVTDEYRKVIDWLNEETSVNFWALEVELWQIGSSPPAPKFNVVCEPNELSKPATPESAELSETKLLQLEFWKGLSDHLEEHGSFNARKPQPQHWYDLSIGTSRAYITLTAIITTGTPRLGCQLNIHHAQSDYIFERLQTEHKAIEALLGELDWRALPDKKSCRIAIYQANSIEDRDRWGEFYAWLTERADAFKDVFAGRIREIQLPASGEGEPAMPVVAGTDDANVGAAKVPDGNLLDSSTRSPPFNESRTR